MPQLIEDRMTERDRKILEDLKERLERGVGSVSIALFGSRARGDYAPDSDMDVLVLVEKANPSVETMVSESAWEVGIENGVVIVPVVYSQDEWENGPERSSLLALAVKSEGVSV